jgi:hypothetical protein
MSGAQAAAHADTVMTKAEESRDCFADGGDYLPLSVWRTRGFDADRIENLSQPLDIRQDSVLGTTYRVKILHRSITKTQVFSRSTVLKRKLEKQELQPAAPLALGDVTPEASPSGSGSNSSSGSDSDSNSSNSSSSSDKKKKKGKKNKKGKKSKKSKKSKKDKKDNKDLSHLII